MGEKRAQAVFFQNKNTAFQKYFFNRFKCISSCLFSITNTYTKPLQKTLLIFSKLLYRLILLTFAMAVKQQLARFQLSIDLSTKNAPIRHFGQTFFFKSIIFSYIRKPGKNVKIRIEFCKLAIYKKTDFIRIPRWGKNFNNFSKTMQIFFFKIMHRKR